MDLKHEQVTHFKFGTGTITAQDSSTVTVKFSKEYGSKKFLYPSAFQSFLDLCDPSINERMGNELHLIQTLAEAERNKRLAEEEKQRALFEQKAASKKKTPAKKRLPKKPLTKKKEVAVEDNK
jgi:hypothetical protein